MFTGKLKIEKMIRKVHLKSKFITSKDRIYEYEYVYGSLKNKLPDISKNKDLKGYIIKRSRLDNDYALIISNLLLPAQLGAKIVKIRIIQPLFSRYKYAVIIFEKRSSKP